MSLQDLELLAPVGSMDALQTVAEAGADAVYLGGKRFNMRLLRPEFNFSDEEIAQAAKYLHQQQKKIYITVNNLYYQQEINTLKDYLRLLQDIQVDALIVQDMGLVLLCRELGITIPLHASVQLGINNLESVHVLEDSGFKRVILSRHLNLQEIKAIHQASPIGIEHFVHGDLCISHNGQCMLSSFMFGESSNRGRCHKPCRWPYQIAGLDQIGNNNPCYYLSPKDLCLYPHLQDMISAGISSFKIEGRMRSKEELALIVKIYRQALDAHVTGSTASYYSEEAMELLEKNRIRDYCCGSIFKVTDKDDINLNGNREPVWKKSAIAVKPLGEEDYSAVKCDENSLSPVQTELTVAVGDLDGLQKMLAIGVDNIIVSLNVMRQHNKKIDLEQLNLILAQRTGQTKVLLELPRIITQKNYDAIYKLKEWADASQVDGFVVNDLGSLKILQSDKRSVWTGYGLNVANSKSAAFMKNLGADRITVSLEIGAADLHMMSPFEVPIELMVHGPLPGMISDLCLIQTALDGYPGECSKECMQSQAVLVDEHGQAYKIYTDYQCRNYLYYPYERCLYPYLHLLYTWGISSLRIDGQHYPLQLLIQVVNIYRQVLQESRTSLRINQERYNRLLKLFPDGLTAMPFINSRERSDSVQ